MAAAAAAATATATATTAAAAAAACAATSIPAVRVVQLVEYAVALVDVQVVEVVPQDSEAGAGGDQRAGEGGTRLGGAARGGVAGVGGAAVAGAPEDADGGVLQGGAGAVEVPGKVAADLSAGDLGGEDPGPVVDLPGGAQGDGRPDGHAARVELEDLQGR